MKNQEVYKTMNIHQKINYKDEKIPFLKAGKTFVDIAFAIGRITLKVNEEEMKPYKDVAYKIFKLDQHIYRQLQLI